MKYIIAFLSLLLFVVNINLSAQSKNVNLILCERYDEQYGAIGRGTIFTKGYLTVVAESLYPINYTDVYIQFDRLEDDGNYYFYKRFAFIIPYGYTTVYFSRIGENDMEFNHSGDYIVWLLDKNLHVISYTTVKIVD